MSGKGETLVIGPNVFVSQDYRYIQWVDDKGVSRSYEIIPEETFEGATNGVLDIKDQIERIAQKAVQQP